MGKLDKKFDEAYFDTRDHYLEAKVAEEYDERRFSSLAGRTFDRLEKNAILRALQSVPKGSTILDCPCGTGRHSESLLESGYNVVGMDISPAMIKVAERKLARFGDRFSARVSDAMNIAEESKEFDAAICIRVLMHFNLQDQVLFLEGVKKQTRSIIVFNQAHDNSWFKFRRKIKNLLNHQLPARSPVTDRDIEILLEKTNLKEKKRGYVLPFISEALVVTAEI